MAAAEDLPQDLVFVDLETTGGNAAYRPDHRGRHRARAATASSSRSGVRWSIRSCPIPAYIESFTGISNEMVAGAPRFAEIAASVLEKLRGAVFVAHNARFDYSFLRSEFRQGRTCGFSAQVLCTVKLSRRLFPEYRTPQSGCGDGAQRTVAAAPGIVHLGDARVMREFWCKLRARDAAAAARSRGADRCSARTSCRRTCRPDLADELPEGPGVYRFFGEDDVLLYVGKSNSLRNRHLRPFRADRRRIQEITGWRAKVRRVDWLETAGELGAMLREAALDQGCNGRCYNRRAQERTRSRTRCGCRTHRGRRASRRRPSTRVERGRSHASASACFIPRRMPARRSTDIARAHAAMPQGAGIGGRQGSCFALPDRQVQGRLRRQGAADPARHAAAAGAVVAEIKAWPFPGRIALRERRPERRARNSRAAPSCMCSIVGPTWARRAPKRSSRELRAEDSSRAFDVDVYRILVRYLAKNPKLDWHRSARTRDVHCSVNDNVRYWVATAPVGAASVLAEELAQFGADDIRERSHDVKFQGTLEVGYRACLWSRTATRVLLSLGSIDAGSSKSVYEAVKRIDWREHLAPGATLACDCSGGNESIRHTIYGSQLLKDAVCDNLRDSTGERPNIKPERPDVLLHLHVEGPTALVSVDFSGESLHRRGYRSEGGRAPLKENVAAAVLLRAGWPQHRRARRHAARSDVRLRHLSDRRRP